MKEKLTGFVIGAAAVAAAFALFGFRGTQSDNGGRFRLHTAIDVSRTNDNGGPSRTYLIDSATGEVWFEAGQNWLPMKRPVSRGE